LNIFININNTKIAAQAKDFSNVEEGIIFFIYNKIRIKKI